MANLPTGEVTLLFTDIDGSTRLLHELGDAYAGVLAEHRRVLRDAFRRHGGVEVDTQGDAFFVAFSGGDAAAAAATDAQRGLRAGPVAVRMGIAHGPSTGDGRGVRRYRRERGADRGGRTRRQVLMSLGDRRCAAGGEIRPARWGSTA